MEKIKIIRSNFLFLKKGKKWSIDIPRSLANKNIKNNINYAYFYTKTTKDVSKILNRLNFVKYVKISTWGKTNEKYIDVFFVNASKQERDIETLRTQFFNKRTATPRKKTKKKLTKKKKVVIYKKRAKNK